MNVELVKLRIAKLLVSLSRISFWRALALGVAPAVEHQHVLRSLAPDGIIDVGANRGQFSLVCRYVKPGVPVVAFEPIPREARRFRRVHEREPLVCLIETALGATNGVAVLHISKSADSSSLLPIGERQTKLFKDTVEVGTMAVPVSRLDDFSDYWVGRTRQLLKLDVQGFELQVLRGGIDTLKVCSYVYVECSEVSLYEGQALRAEVQAFLSEQGFLLKERYNEQRSGRELIQADYLFSR
ncbi:MAG: FkbM family methyltransferase [Dechloromonas sp.]|nr:MAG: FkbM family methyltransferase [Dechloromonas sp.]